MTVILVPKLATRRAIARDNTALSGLLENHRIPRRRQQGRSRTASSPLPILTPTPVHSPNSSSDFSDTKMSNYPPAAFVLQDPKKRCVISYSESFKTPPTITDGVITPDDAYNFFSLLTRYLDHRGIADDKKVAAIRHSTIGHRFDNFWAMNPQFLDPAFTLDEWFDAFRSRFLDPDWVEDVIRKHIRCGHPENVSFDAWLNMVIHFNNILPANKKLKSEALREILRSNWNSHLNLEWKTLTRTERDRIDKLTDFLKWVEEIMEIDQRATCRREAASASCAANPRPGPSMPAFNVNNSVNAVHPGSSNPPPAVPPPPPALNNSNHNGADPYANLYHNGLGNNSHNGNGHHGHGSNGNGHHGRSGGPDRGHGGENQRYQPYNSSGRRFPPKMKTPERGVVRTNGGCFRCRRLWCGHDQWNCPNEPPPREGYEVRTQEMADNIRWALVRDGYPDPAANRRPVASGSNAVAATQPYSYQSAAPPTSFQQTARIEEVRDTRPSTPVASGSGSRSAPTMPRAESSAAGGVAAVLPRNFVPRDDGFSDDDNDRSNYRQRSRSPVYSRSCSPADYDSPGGRRNDQDESPSPAPRRSRYTYTGKGKQVDRGFYSEVCPTPAKHLVFSAFVLHGGFRVSSFDCLLDPGSPFVLITQGVVNFCRLKIEKLKTPQRMSLAMTKNEIVTTDYVHLDLSSLNGAWSSRTTQALVVDELCYPILLGIPFLTRNKIVIDMEDRTAVNKTTGFDLLNLDPYQDSCADRAKPTAGCARTATTTRQGIYDERFDRLENSHVRYPSLCPKTIRTPQFEHVTRATDIICAVKETIVSIERKAELDNKEQDLKKDYEDIFSPIPHASLLPDTVTCRIRLRDEYKKIAKRNYSCPRAFKESFQKLIQDRLDSGFIRRSQSQYASPSFCIPKKDPTAMPRWVCDYRQLNENTVPDNYTLPRVDDILADCGKGKIWAVFDMTDAFFQTRMHPDDIEKTAVSTPFGTFEWLVMPMGFRNAPPIHQRRVSTALSHLIGKICHVYMDDIIVWSNSIEEHIENCKRVMDALRVAKLYLNPKKTRLFCEQVKFLGHKISAKGIEPDDEKVAKILEWPQPRSATDVRRFLGLVRYIATFLPNLAEHTQVLDKLNRKEYEKALPVWSDEYKHAFQAIKNLVVSPECLTVIDHGNMGNNKIFVTTDASDAISGAVLSYGETWETARPVAFDSESFKDAELRYPVHEKELLAIMRALRKWKTDLLGVPFFVMTDHRTLTNFNTQRDMSRRQTRWMEELAIYDAKIVYIKGEDNTVADALSRYPHPITSSVEHAQVLAQGAFPLNDNHVVACVNTGLIRDPFSGVCALVCQGLNEVWTPQFDGQFASDLKAGYETDPWCKKFLSASQGMNSLKLIDGFWFLDNRLVVPRVRELREYLFRLAHDNFGHFGLAKSYDILRSSYFWPGMRRDLELGYIPQCDECQRNKSSTSRKPGPLHPLPVADDRLKTISIDFTGPLPDDEGYNMISTISCQLGADYRFIPCRDSTSAMEFALLFMDNWYCENGMPTAMIIDRDKLWVSEFWKHLLLLTGIRCRMSSAFHPESDGLSERTNKTVIQALRFHVERNQKGWVRALPRIRFQVMCTTNKSTGFSGFQLRMGMIPRSIPPLVAPTGIKVSANEASVREIIEQVHQDTQDARDNLMLAKVTQAFWANETRAEAPKYAIGDLVMLSTENRRKRIMHNGSVEDKRASKLVSRWEGPYIVTHVNDEFSTVTLQLPEGDYSFPTFHTRLVKPYKSNDDEMFPGRKRAPPDPVEVDGELEHFVEKIVDHKSNSKGKFYLVRWQGEGPENDLWIHESYLQDNEALGIYLSN